MGGGLRVGMEFRRGLIWNDALEGSLNLTQRRGERGGTQSLAEESAFIFWCSIPVRPPRNSAPLRLCRCLFSTASLAKNADFEMRRSFPAETVR